MDPSISQDLVADLIPILATVGGVVAASVLAFFAARRARAARQRQIESADMPASQRGVARRTVELDEGQTPEGEAGATLGGAPAAPPRLDGRPDAQILPFPRGGAPAPE